jgi:hypothetical protein
MPVSPIAVAHLSRVSPASAAARLAILAAAALISIPITAAQRNATLPAATVGMPIECVAGSSAATCAPEQM